MNVLLSFVVQLTGFYILYNTSARAIFTKRRHNHYLYKHRNYSKVIGGVMLLASFILFMQSMGIGVGFFFALISLMVMSGYIIVLLPLQKNK